MTSVRFRNPDNPDKPDAIPVRSPERESIELPVKTRAPRSTHTAHSPLTTSVYDALTDSDPGTPPPPLRSGISHHHRHCDPVSHVTASRCALVSWPYFCCWLG
eukprot:1051191_1